MGTRSILCGILFCVLGSISGYGQTTVPGGVVSGTWTKANSPYLVQAAIMVADGTTLTIEPGVKIEFQGSFKLLVLGNVIAAGAVNDTITFTADIGTHNYTFLLTDTNGKIHTITYKDITC